MNTNMLRMLLELFMQLIHFLLQQKEMRQSSESE